MTGRGGPSEVVGDVEEVPANERLARVLVERWPALRWPTLAAFVAIVAGGLVAAATRPAGLQAGSWVAALLVLVGGVAQGVLGAGRVLLPDAAPSSSRVAAEAALWNAAVAGTIVGSLRGLPAITVISGLALLADLVLVWRAIRAASPASRPLARLLEVLLLLVFVSVPVGMALAWARHS